MIKDLESLQNKRFGRLVVETARRTSKGVPDRVRTEIRCSCRCDCGNNKEVRWSDLQSGCVSSCGCLKEETRGANLKTHGLSHLKEHTVWLDMNRRCSDPNSSSFRNYGGRGISVCPSWSQQNPDGFLNFLSDLGRMPSGSFTLERVNVDVGYSPSNCMWTDDSSLQSYNTRLRGHNTSGKTGVCEHSRTTGEPLWVAHISRNGIRRRRYFRSFEEACLQRDEWELELYGFNHSNSVHGK